MDTKVIITEADHSHTTFHVMTYKTPQFKYLLINDCRVCAQLEIQYESSSLVYAFSSLQVIFSAGHTIIGKICLLKFHCLGCLKGNDHYSCPKTPIFIVGRLVLQWCCHHYGPDKNIPWKAMEVLSSHIHRKWCVDPLTNHSGFCSKATE